MIDTKHPIQNLTDSVRLQPDTRNPRHARGATHHMVCRDLRLADQPDAPDVTVVNLPVGGGRALVGAQFGDLRVGHELGEHGAVAPERRHQPAIQLHVLTTGADRTAEVDLTRHPDRDAGEVIRRDGPRARAGQT